jgi:glycosidase
MQFGIPRCVIKLAVTTALFSTSIFSTNALVQAAPSNQAATNPTNVTIAGSLQSELGCPGDWQPDCAATHLTYSADDDVWQGTFAVPAGAYEYKAPLNNSWDVNYGKNAQPGGDNIPLNLSANANVKFYYDHKSHWVTDNQNSVIAVAPGSFQSELGCPGDWQPDCLRSWLQDVDGDGIYVFETTALPVGSYEGKVALNESWEVNYGQGGVQNGPNLAFAVPAAGAKVTFKYDSATKVLSILSGQTQDGNVAWDGLRHDSRDTLYRTPGGAVMAGADVKIRFRTFHNDVTGVKLRLYDLNASGQRLVNMTIAASDVPCYQAELASERCDFWEATVSSGEPNNFWYRFIVNDGSKAAYYGDNTSALDGGLGATTADPVDQSFALMFYEPSMVVPGWAKDQVIYQIFPDRFRNGDPKNDPKDGDVRYDDPVIALPWGTLPEGYCRNYADGSTNCPWRFDTTPPDWSPTKEGPRGRDYYGGDLQGVIDKLDYLKSFGVTAIYFNPIFEAKSNHRYDTSNFKQIDPALGNNATFNRLVREARRRGIRIILDGVFNHMSSDSPQFDRYGHYPGRGSKAGACESANSIYRNWFVFRQPSATEPAPCVPSTTGGVDKYYVGWFGFDSIPEIRKTTPAVQEYFLTDNNSVAKLWLRRGAAGWRMDVMGDASFPNGYWEEFRSQVRQTDPNALIIGELWQKDSTLLRYLRGDRADTTMNYRLRDAVLGLLVPGGFDSKGFGDSGRVIKPSEFAARVSAIQEDYSEDTFYSLMNLLDSHDTERLLWTLTPGPETLADKAANEVAGKMRVKLASLIQFTMPGAPTVYYGDEVAVTGDDDPDDRRTYPWMDVSGAGNPDNNMLAHYTALANLRKSASLFTSGDLKMLLADDASGVVAYGRKNDWAAAVIAINRSETTRTVSIPVAGFIPNGVGLETELAVNTAAANVVVSNGAVQVELAPLSGLVLANYNTDLNGPSAPANLQVTGEGNASVSLSWSMVSGAAGYNIYRSVLSGGGWVKVNADLVTATSYTDTGLRNARSYYYVVKSVDAAGNEGAASAEAAGLPHPTIGWANTQWPPSITHVVSAINRTPDVYGQVWIDGVTNAPGNTDGLTAQLGYGPDGSDPASSNAWTWVDASFNVDAGNNDEFKASLLPEVPGNYDYAYRYSTTNGREWVYADLDGIGNGYSADQAGALSVSASSDTLAPAVPQNLVKVSASPAGVALAWDAVTGDDTLYAYEVLRSSTSGGPYAKAGTVLSGTTSYNDTAVTEGATYYYVVRAVDSSFNRSGNSNEVSAQALLRTMTLTFNVTVPAGTPADKSVYIAGFLDRLDGNNPQWNPGGVVLTKVDATTWRITFTGKETTQIEYKYALGSWDFVEKDGACGEIPNRTLTLSYGATGVQTVNDGVPNWRNVSPCGN